MWSQVRELAPPASRLPAPGELAARHPAPEPVRAGISRARRAVRDILHGADARRLLVVAGPCSVHDPEAALDYAVRLRGVADRTRDALLVVMRTYVEKPRSTTGWKGLVNDPDLDGRCDVARGLSLSRELLRGVGELGLPCASELLDPLAARYLEDLLSWGCIGARTAGSQPHRELASGAPMPVGFKNGLDGNVGTALEGLASAGRPHAFLGVDAAGAATLVRTAGNPDGHVVLRGGAGVPNYDPESVAWACARAGQLGLGRGVLVDCSHGNSHKDHRLQARACRAVLEQWRRGQRGVAGLMLESYLEAGRQTWSTASRPRRDLSITDACIGWGETEDLLGEIAETVRATG
jgi:3-deoxy-7-phosphoheptulonate synthase